MTLILLQSESWREKEEPRVQPLRRADVRRLQPARPREDPQRGAALPVPKVREAVREVVRPPAASARARGQAQLQVLRVREGVQEQEGLAQAREKCAFCHPCGGRERRIETAVP